MAQAHSPAPPRLVPATTADLPVMQNLGRFYVYDMARYCGLRAGYACPADGLWECMDFAPYFAEPAFQPFLLRSGEQPAGFAVVKDLGSAGWNMEQFFVTAPFQQAGHGRRIVHELLARFPGAWRIEVLPENARGLAFWRRVAAAADGAVRETREIVDDAGERTESVVLNLVAR